MFHKHKWKKITITYAPNIRELGMISGDRLSPEELQGVTTILWECEVCQRLRKEIMLGKIGGSE